jgi:hypothetical protein
MSHESNYFGNVGSKQPNSGFDDFRKQGLNDSQAREAAAAAERARNSGSKS